MRKADLSPERQQQLVRCVERPNCFALVPPPVPRQVSLDHAVSGRIQKAHEALGALQQASAGLPDLDLITRTLARREAVQSSQIEGNRTSLTELLEYEATRSQEGAAPDAVEVERYVQALDVGLQTLDRQPGRGAISQRLVKAVHAVLMADALPRLRAGEYRDTQVWIGGGRQEDATFVPPPPDAVPACMDELEASMLQYARREDEMMQLSLVVQLALAHAQFETIHPFADGNGRVGRLIMPLIMAAEGYPPLYLSGYLLRYRRAYYDALAEVQLKGKWTRWVGFLCDAIVHSASTSLALAKDLVGIHDAFATALSDLRTDATARRFPRLLLGRPIISVPQAAEVLDVSFVVANNAVKLLVERGLLAEPAGRRNRVFHATRILERLAQP